jgi:hypothetical protein
MKNITVALRNKDRPELGWTEVALPANEETLNAALAQIEILYTSPERNCELFKDTLEGLPFEHIEDKLVNADELNYLAMRLDGFDGYEITQFQAAAYCENITDVEGLINLTFNTHNYTVVTDFSDFAAIGKKYYLDEHIAVAADKFEKINAADIGYNLLQNGDGTVTPFGVVYKHGKELEIPYQGTTLPQYSYTGESVMFVGLTSAYDDAGTDKIAWLELPCPDTGIEKALHRLGVDEGDVCMAHICPEDIPDGIAHRLNVEKETIRSLNDMCRAIAAVKPEDCPKLDAACEFAEVTAARDITAITENIAHFDLYPNVSTPKEYGYHIAEKAGAFQYGQSLSEYFDFKALGEDRMKNEYGRFSERGYMVFNKSPEVLDAIQKQEHSGGMGLNM